MSKLIERKTICRRFRIDLLEKIDTLARNWKPQTTPNRIMEMEVEEFINRHERSTRKERAHEA